MGYDPERLHVHRLAMALCRAVRPVCGSARRGGRPDLASQAERAAASVPLNIAEGAAELPPREKARFYRMARRSAEETRTALRLIAEAGLVSHSSIAAPRRLAARLTFLLLRLIHSTLTHAE
jgi:four helix bundle protein